MDGFSYSGQLAKVVAGFKGGNFLRSPNLSPKMTFVEGYPAETNSQFGHQAVKQGTPEDAWNMRRSK